MLHKTQMYLQWLLFNATTQYTTHKQILDHIVKSNVNTQQTYQSHAHTLTHTETYFFIQYFHTTRTQSQT
jgi:hypothetical protein